MSDVNDFNAQTGEAILRPYTEEERTQAEHDSAIAVTPETVPIEEDALKISALAKLQSLGLTEDEAKAIAGI
jgi:hypothetical protein